MAAAAAAFLPCPANVFMAPQKTNNLINVGNSSTLTSPNMAAAAVAAMSAAAANWRLAQMAAVANNVVGSSLSTVNNSAIQDRSMNISLHDTNARNLNGEFISGNPLFNLFPTNPQQFSQILASTAQSTKSINSPDDDLNVSRNLISTKKTMPPSFLINNISNTQLF